MLKKSVLSRFLLSYCNKYSIIEHKLKQLIIDKLKDERIFLENFAGHVKMADYLAEWTAKAGPDNFIRRMPRYQSLSQANPTIPLPL